VDKRLLLLGVLRTQGLHGYGLMDYLDAHAMGGVAIGRSNAYRLLRAMEKDGWIKSRTERNRNRPMRQVYAVTRKGEAEFQRLLREVIASYDPGGSIGVFSLNYLHELEPHIAASLLEERKAKVELRAKQLREIPDDVVELHPALDLMTEQCQLELRWLRKKINALNSLTQSESAA